MKTEKHHIIPNCLDGMDIPENVVVIPKEEHGIIHKLLNVAYYFVRKFRFKNASSFKKDTDYYIRLRAIHKQYFASLPTLSDETQELHHISILAQITALEGMYGIENPLPTETFDQALYAYHNLLHKISLK